MITAIMGVLEARGPDWVQVKVGGVSLHIFTPASTLSQLGNQGDEVRLHTRLFIKDDEAELYGFPTPEALRLFNLLNTVTGIGRRLSLALLSALGHQSLVTAIATGDVETLNRVTGVGRKSAGRVVLELKGKLERELAEVPVPTGGSDNGDVVAALMALGYTAAEARQAVASMGSMGDLPLEDRVRSALQEMAGR